MLRQLQEIFCQQADRLTKTGSSKQKPLAAQADKGFFAGRANTACPAAKIRPEPVSPALSTLLPGGSCDAPPCFCELPSCPRYDQSWKLTPGKSL